MKSFRAKVQLDASGSEDEDIEDHKFMSNGLHSNSPMVQSKSIISDDAICHKDLVESFEIKNEDLIQNELLKMMNVSGSKNEYFEDHKFIPNASIDQSKSIFSNDGIRLENLPESFGIKTEDEPMETHISVAESERKLAETTSKLQKVLKIRLKAQKERFEDVQTKLEKRIFDMQTEFDGENACLARLEDENNQLEEKIIETENQLADTTSKLQENFEKELKIQIETYEAKLRDVEKQAYNNHQELIQEYQYQLSTQRSNLMLEMQGEAILANLDQLGLTREVFEKREQKIDFWKKDTELKETIITSLLSQVEVLTKDTELMERTIESLSSQLEDQKDENQKIKLSSSQSIQEKMDQVTRENLEMTQEIHRILAKYQSANVVEPDTAKRECNQKMDSVSKDIKTLEKAVEIKEKEIRTNPMPNEVKTDESKSLFLEQEIKNLECDLYCAKVMVHEKVIGAVMGYGGDRIHQIQKDSGTAGIRVEKRNCKDKGYIPVHITGTLQQIQAAKILLKKAILERKGKKKLEKAVEINEREIVTNELPKEVKTEKSNFWFFEQEIKTLDSGLQRAEVIIHDKGAAVIIGPDYLTKSRHCAGGSRIEKLRKDCKADITINPGTDNRRIVIITGTLQQIETAKIILKNRLQFLKNSRNDPCNMKINIKN